MWVSVIVIIIIIITIIIITIIKLSCLNINQGVESLILGISSILKVD